MLPTKTLLLALAFAIPALAAGPSHPYTPSAVHPSGGPKASNSTGSPWIPYYPTGRSRHHNSTAVPPSGFRTGHRPAPTGYLPSSEPLHLTARGS
ncbi:hypothetical protein K461DRAFT_279124 [Myriangium duriaei CBS 260.36]|uniref:Uncharacterized protein n=1 Tax=Myriangium duriaei CBS 260.36 TaxID=1168546 RepID=A0A9P4IZP3_9PEZI|nr:hypothetical protein K461DRAFT_279124 [Myriangium duriaei CBS 260.36]